MNPMFWPITYFANPEPLADLPAPPELAEEEVAQLTEEVEEALARLNDPTFATMSAITMAVWGRRHAGGSQRRA